MADELRSWRGRLDLTQASAAKALGVPYPTLRGWEGGRYPALPQMARLLMRFIERESCLPVAAIGPVPVDVVIPSPVTSTSPRVAPILGRREVQPFFRQSGKGRSRGDTA